MSRLDRRRHELLKEVEEARKVTESADEELDLAVRAALAGGCPVTYVALFADVSRQFLYRNYNAAKTGVRARRQSVERLREQLDADAGDEATRTDGSDSARCTRERPVERPSAEERESPSEANSLDGRRGSSTRTDSPPAGGQHPVASSQPGSRFLPPRKVGRRGPSPFWPADAPKLGSNTADKRPAPARKPHTPKPGDDLLGTLLPSEPWGPEHASELAGAVAAALVFKPGFLDALWKCKTTEYISSDDWVHHAVVLRRLLESEMECKMLEAWFKLVPIPKDDRTPAEQKAVGWAEDTDPLVMRWIEREDLQVWRGRVAAYERGTSWPYVRRGRDR